MLRTVDELLIDHPGPAALRTGRSDVDPSPFGGWLKRIGL